jgi:hypothetical protein
MGILIASFLENPNPLLNVRSPSPGWGGLADFFALPTLIALAIATSW